MSIKDLNGFRFARKSFEAIVQQETENVYNTVLECAHQDQIKCEYTLRHWTSLTQQDCNAYFPEVFRRVRVLFPDSLITSDADKQFICIQWYFPQESSTAISEPRPIHPSSVSVTSS